MTEIARKLRTATRRLSRRVDELEFASPVTEVYNPLAYARPCHEVYIERFGNSRKRVVFLGMNPGPYGMAQTGVPFGEVNLVRDWMGIELPVKKPAREHPKRPVVGFDCPRSEVSGRRLWGAVAEHFGAPEKFFRRHYVANYCPLVFMEESGRNRTPDKLSADERDALYEICDEHLRKLVRLMEPQWIIGIGAFAQKRAGIALADIPGLRIANILHPSPANPRANKDWTGEVRRQLTELGLCGSGS
jgi:single-strand selective monofunctional uracil DNA glycosylase